MNENVNQPNPIAQQPPAAPPPTFMQAVQATQQRQEQRLTDLTAQASTAQPPAPTPAQEAPAQQGVSDAQQAALEQTVQQMTPEQFKAWMDQQPAGALKMAAENIGRFYEAQMRHNFGDLIELGDLAQKDPAVRKKLERIVKDPQARKFILDDAFSVYDPKEYGAPGAAPPPAQTYSTPEQIREEVRSEFQMQQARVAYEADRSRELEALVREAPALNWTDPKNVKAASKVQHIIDVAEKRSQKTNTRVSYRDIADELDMIGSAAPPHAIPQTSGQTTPPAQQMQAPTNEAEARSRMAQLLNQHGDLFSLAASLPRR